MSLNRWLSGKEINFEKIKKEMIKLFLTEKEKEKEYEKRIYVSFWIEDLIEIIAENLSMKEDTVRKCILTLLINHFISIDFMDNIYYYHELTQDLKNSVLDPLDHNSIIRLEIRRLLGIDAPELEKEIIELNEDSIDLDLDEDLW